jgi:DNA-directed RNA polymerase specialized sigma24 family protein
VDRTTVEQGDEVNDYSSLSWEILLDVLHPPGEPRDARPCFPDGSPIEREPAWVEAYRRLTAYAGRVLPRRLVGELEPEELARALLVRLSDPAPAAVKLLAHVRAARSPEAYLVQLVRNAALDEERRRLRRAHHTLVTEPPCPPPAFPAEDAEWLHAGLAKLPEHERCLVTQKVFEDRSIAELAAACGVRYSTMAVRLTRILGKLRRLLAD